LHQRLLVYLTYRRTMDMRNRVHLYKLSYINRILNNGPGPELLLDPKLLLENPFG
jgi:hypothetical protein